MAFFEIVDVLESVSITISNKKLFDLEDVVTFDSVNDFGICPLVQVQELKNKK
jgi:hypothetical protein